MRNVALILLCVVFFNPLSAQNSMPQDTVLLSNSVIKLKTIGNWLHEPVYLRASYPGFIIDLSGNLADSFIKGEIITFTRQYNIVKTKKGKRLKPGDHYYFRTDLPEDLSFQ